MLEYQPNVFLIDPREKFQLANGQIGEIYFFQLAKFRQWLKSSFVEVNHVKFYIPTASKEQLNMEYIKSHSISLDQIHFIDNPFDTWISIVLQVEQSYKKETEFNIVSQSDHHQTSQTRVHPQAQVHPSAVVEGEVLAGASIGPLCYVGPNSLIGEGTRLDSGVHIYPHVRVGDNCKIESGVVIGSHGFGFGPDEKMIPHLSGVEISDQVYIGANSVVASGCVQPTRLGTQVALDSFVQIGHHAQIGDRVKMASQSGVGGSTHIGHDSLIAGGAQISDGLIIGPYVKIAAKAGVVEDILSHTTVGGYPSMPITKWHRMNQLLKKMLP